MSEPNKLPESRKEIEQRLVHLCLKSRNATEELLNSGIKDEFFEEELRPIMEAVYLEYLDGNRLLTTEGYSNYLLQKGVRKDLQKMVGAYARCLTGVYDTTDNLGFLKQQVIENYVARNSSQLVSEFVSEAKKRGYYCAARNLVDGLTSAMSLIEFKKSVFASLSESKEDYLRHINDCRNNQEEIITCDMPEIDDAMTVGFKPQHLTLFVADVGGHKTNLMLNVALKVWEAGHNVLFVPLEMNRIDLMHRIVANKCEIDHRKLARPQDLEPGELDQIKEGKIVGTDKTLWSEKGGQFCILDADERTSVSTLQREIEKRAFAFKPKLVVIDYIANLKPDSRYQGRNDLEIGEILKNLRFLGKQYGFHILSAAQMGRAAIKALREDMNATPDSTAIRGSHEYSADADTIFILMKNKHENDKLKIFCLKARHGKSGHTRELDVCPQQCRITSKEYQQEIAAHNLAGQSSEFLNESTESIAQEAGVTIDSMGFATSVDLFDDDDDLDKVGI